MCVDIELVCVHTILSMVIRLLRVIKTNAFIPINQPGNDQQPASTTVSHVPPHVTSYHAVNPTSSARRNLVLDVHIRASLDEHPRGGFLAFAKGEHERCLIVLSHE